MEDEKVNNQHAAVLTQLSDIKASLATNTEKTSNMEKNIEGIKQDIKEIRADLVSRREFQELQKIVDDHEMRQRKSETFEDNWTGRYAVVAVIFMFIIGWVGTWLSSLLKK